MTKSLTTLPGYNFYPKVAVAFLFFPSEFKNFVFMCNRNGKGGEKRVILVEKYANGTSKRYFFCLLLADSG